MLEIASISKNFLNTKFSPKENDFYCVFTVYTEYPIPYSLYKTLSINIDF